MPDLDHDLDLRIDRHPSPTGSGVEGVVRHVPCRCGPHAVAPVAAGPRRDRTIDIVTRGAKTGERRRTEIWFTRVSDEVFITGTPAGDGTPLVRVTFTGDASSLNRSG